MSSESGDSDNNHSEFEDSDADDIYGQVPNMYEPTNSNTKQEIDMELVQVLVIVKA